MTVIDAAIDYRDPDASSGISRTPGRLHPGRIIGEIVHYAHRVIEADGDDLRISLQRRQSADRNGKRSPLDQVELRMQVPAPVVHSRVVCFGGNLAVLHDHSYGLALGRSVLGLVQESRELGRDSRRHHGVLGPGRRTADGLSKGHARRQEQQQAQALAPGGAVAFIASCRPLGFPSTHHKSHPFFSCWGKDRDL